MDSNGQAIVSINSDPDALNSGYGTKSLQELMEGRSTPSLYKYDYEGSEDSHQIKSKGTGYSSALQYSY